MASYSKDSRKDVKEMEIEILFFLCHVTGRAPNINISFLTILQSVWSFTQVDLLVIQT